MTSVVGGQHYGAYGDAANHIQPADMGMAAWTGDPGLCIAGAAAGVAGTLQLRKLAVPGVLNITNIYINVDVAANTPTAAQCFAGVWDGNGRLVGLSADQSGLAFAAPAFATIPLVAGAGMPNGPFISDTPYIYVGYWFNGTAGPGLSRGREQNTGTINGPPSFPAVSCRAVTANVGLTTIGTAPLNLGTLSRAVGAGSLFWCGVG